MALTFPRLMPTAGVADSKLEPPTIDFLAPELGGHVGAVSAGFPLWRLELTLAEMDRDAADAWRAFLRSLDGAKRTFYGRDLLRDYPKAYPNGFAGLTRVSGPAFPADGAPADWSVNGTRDVLTLEDMPADFTLGEGDLVGFAWTTAGQERRTLAAAIEAAVADVLGDVAVTIRPALPDFVPTDADVYLFRPSAIMRIVTDGTETGPEDAVATAGGRLVAIQDLRP